MAERIARRARVSGRVQGVGYRASTERRARALGLAGFARNEADGTVTVHAEGSEEAVATLMRALRDGPPAAQVSDMREAPAETAGASSFTSE